MARNLKRSADEAILFSGGTTDDGRQYRVLISQAAVRRMISRAQRNTGNRCQSGPMTVVIVNTKTES